MNKATRTFRLKTLIVIGACLLASVSAIAAKPSKPNIVFILVDDLGWADIACFGSQFYETPNIDALAKSGVKMTSAYAASPVCSPTRGSIMTGKYPARTQTTDWFGGNRRAKLLPARRQTSKQCSRRHELYRESGRTPKPR